MIPAFLPFNHLLAHESLPQEGSASPVGPVVVVVGTQSRQNVASSVQQGPSIEGQRPAVFVGEI